MAEVCSDPLKKNLGLTRCKKLPSMPRSIIETKSNFYFTPSQLETAAAFKTALDAAIQAGYATRVYLWPLFKNIEPLSEEAIRLVTPLGTTKVRDGRYAWRFMISENMCIHKAMFTHRSSNGRVFLYDDKSQLFGTKDASGNFYGFTIDLLDTEKLSFSDGTNPTMSPIYLSLADNLEADQDGYVLDRSVASVINTIDRLTDVTLEVSGAITADAFAVKVYVSCDGTPVNGLLEADFILKNNAGAAQTIDSVTEDNGTYTIDAGAGTFVDGTLTLRAPNLLTVKAYEPEAAITINVP